MNTIYFLLVHVVGGVAEISKKGVEAAGVVANASSEEERNTSNVYKFRGL